jgi:hypothetical protein
MELAPRITSCSNGVPHLLDQSPLRRAGARGGARSPRGRTRSPRDPCSARRHFCQTNTPVTLPAHPKQPSRRRDDARRADAAKAARQRLRKALEPLCRRPRVQSRIWPIQRVLSMILQHVDERIANLTRATERLPMPAISPKPPAPKQQAVHPPGYAHHQAAHPGAQRLLVRGLDNQVHVIGLHRVVNDPKRIAVAVTKCSEHRTRHLLTPQRAHDRAQRDVHRTRTVVPRSHAMWRVPQARRQRLPPSPHPRTPAPLHCWKLELQLLS